MGPAHETARLYEEFSGELYRFCLGRLRTPEDAEDAVQSTFIRVHQALGKGVVPHHPAAWLYRIATNVCLSRRELTQRRAQWQAPDELDVREVAAPDIDPEAGRELLAAVSSMPKNLRDAILLREWQGLSYAEIADSMHTTVPAVETLIHRARRHLTRALGPLRRTGVVDVAAAFARLRSLAAAAGPAPLAAGAAVLALGGAVVGADVGKADSHRRPAPAVSTAAVAPSTERPAARTIPAARRTAARTPSAPSPAPAPSTQPPAAPAPRTTAAAPAAAPVPAAPAPVRTTAEALAPVLSLPAAVEPVLPTVTAPAVTVPAVTVPSLTVPAVPLTTPTVTLPAVTLP